MSVARSLVCGLLIASCVFTQGCGTIFFRFKKQPVWITTVPEGASVSIDGGPWLGEKTPCKVMIQPNADHEIKLEYVKEDGSKLTGLIDEPRSMRIAMLVCDILLTAGIGLLVDHLTGALWWFPNRKMHVILQGEGGAPALAPEPVPAVDPAPTADPAPSEKAETAPCIMCGEPKATGQKCPSCGAR